MTIPVVDNWRKRKNEVKKIKKEREEKKMWRYRKGRKWRHWVCHCHFFFSPLHFISNKRVQDFSLNFFVTFSPFFLSFFSSPFANEIEERWNGRRMGKKKKLMSKVNIIQICATCNRNSSTNQSLYVSRKLSYKFSCLLDCDQTFSSLSLSFLLTCFLRFHHHPFTSFLHYLIFLQSPEITE